MYYTSKNKSELESYIQLVDSNQDYETLKSTTWSKVFEHPNGLDFAVARHKRFEVSSLEELEKLSEDWFESNI